MLYLVSGLAIFFGVHATGIVAPRFRERQIEALGEGPWRGIYAFTSIGGLALIVWGWMQIRFDASILYMPPDWARHATAPAVLVAFVLVAAAYTPSGRIKSTLVHPMMIGVLIWAGAHLFANGDIASVLVFGAFLVYAVWYLTAVRRRDNPRPEFAGYAGDFIAIGGGGLLYVVFAFWLHGWLFNVSPF